MKEYKQVGAYGLLINDGRILLINKVSGPYDNKLDLPGGTIEFGERPEDALKRELLEETGIDVLEDELIDTDSVFFDWQYQDDVIVKVHHIGIFYRILNYQNEIKKNIDIDTINDDSLGADWYNISDLKKDNLSSIAIMELEKLGYKL